MTTAALDAAAVDRLDWGRIERDLDAYGAAVAPKLLSPEACRAIAALYPEDARFRSPVVMARHGFGRGEYKYFAEPLPDPVAELRRDLYPRLAPIANHWNEAMGVATAIRPSTRPSSLGATLPARRGRRRCCCATAPATTIACIRTSTASMSFPLQVAILLSEPGQDFTGGEFVLTEQRPRMQSRAEVVSLDQGDGVIFAVRQRPVQGARGPYRAALRHGVSRIKSGERFTLGVIFHDAT